MPPIYFVTIDLMGRFFIPRLRDFIFIIVFGGALLVGMRMLNTDSDLGRHLTLGNIILNSHQIPTQDLLSYTKAGQSRPAYEWFAQVLFAVSYRLLNLDGVVLLTSIVLAGAFLIVYIDAAQRRQIPFTAWLLTLWGAAVSSVH